LVTGSGRSGACFHAGSLFLPDFTHGIKQDYFEGVADQYHSQEEKNRTPMGTKAPLNYFDVALTAAEEENNIRQARIGNTERS
jgi:hypothetical protein